MPVIRETKLGACAIDHGTLGTGRRGTSEAAEEVARSAQEI
jgi:hypothetical protein